jgi:hypothetical protein
LVGGKTGDSKVNDLAVARCYGDDEIAPIIANLRPAPGSTIRDTTPLIAATVRDNQTKLAKSNMNLYVDGRRKTSFSYEGPPTGSPTPAESSSQDVTRSRSSPETLLAMRP